MPMTTLCATVAHALIASSKPKVELDYHAETCVLNDNCLATHDRNEPVNVYSYDVKIGHKCAKTVNAAV